ncbi:pyocin activator PrtN family protein [Pseudotabrizicola alkalilacus]|uniref:Pyocin activator protein PrtN n=1 Tax=Pseudotabrizicola alkalilacus TaxID=2305252 RepID=A0A411Z4E2_9RHOB|nr:pyocin activator PrtN family protein [Pseudotabrizicola alkalilacus]RGP37946.1 Pyocin activator protein PrtN [Pseudotabrizicola alkalilacus]
MKTLMMLLAKHEAPVISAEVCCKEYFPPLTLPVFMKKINAGEIPLPLIRMEPSQKGAKMVHLTDLAEYIDQKREAAAKELKAMGS